MYNHRRMAIAVFALVAIALVIGGVFRYANTRLISENDWWIGHTHEVIASLERLKANLVGAERDQRSYVFTEDKSFLAAFHSDAQQAREELSHLKELTADNSRQQSTIEEFGPLMEAQIDRLQREARAVQPTDRQNNQLAIRVSKSPRITDALSGPLKEMHLEEENLLQRRYKASTESYAWGVTTNILAFLASLGVVGAVCFLVQRALTARQREQEEKFRILVEGVQDYAIFMLDPQGNVATWNAGAERVKGYKAEEIIGKNLSQFYRPEDQASGHPQEVLAQALANGHYVEEGQRVRKDGSVFWANVALSALRDSAGKHIGFVKITRDITERKQTEEELRRARLVAEEASQAKSEFLANMSHEIRTPMNGIIGMTELALDTDLRPEQRDYLDTVKSSADALLTILNDILDFSKLEAGKLELDPMPFQLRDALGDLLKPLALRAHKKHIELAYHVEPRVPDDLFGDLGRLRQVIINLVGNAIKFTEVGEVVVQVHTESEDQEHVDLLISVADTGIGIPAEKQPAIFAPFAQADGSMARKYGGTGLGLTISAQLVKLMGGRISLKSKPGQGSTFSFTLRLAKAAPGSAHELSNMGVSLQGVRVLIIDDNATTRSILTEMLSGWQMQPYAVEDGQAGMKAIRHAEESGVPFRLVLLDATLPDLQGGSIIEEIKRQASKETVVILMISSFEGRRRPSARYCISKPVKQSDLLDTVQTALTSTRRADESAVHNRIAELRRTEPTLPPMRPLHILLAEDNRINQRVATGLLEKAGHSVRTVTNGREALAVLMRERFDIVLMDLQMPELDGFEATAAIREREAGTNTHVPIIALTAHAMKGDRERCLAAGMDGYATKPIQLEELRNVIAQCAPVAPERSGASLNDGDGR